MPRLFEIAEENGLRGRHVRLMERIAAEAQSRFGRTVPINATGGIGALLNELGLDVASSTWGSSLGMRGLG